MQIGNLIDTPHRSCLTGRLERAIIEAGRRQGWWTAPIAADRNAGGKAGILVALSGGGDSMALLTLLLRCSGGRVEAAHLEHGLRGDASAADARFVRDHCQRVGVRCHIRYARVGDCRRRGESSEAAGRRLRYEFLVEIARDRELPFIATGHNVEDRVETVLFNLFRGTGLAGLAGIPEVTRFDFAPDRAVVRPLIDCTRGDLRLYLAAREIPWREDGTNDENLYSRNRIRNELLPWVRRNLNQRAEEVLTGLARECDALNASIEAEAREKLGAIAVEFPVALAAWDIRAARRLPVEQLSHLIRSQGRALSLPVLDRCRTLELCGLIRRSGRWRFQWAGDIEVCAAKPLLGWVRRDDIALWRAHAARWVSG